MADDGGEEGLDRTNESAPLVPPIYLYFREGRQPQNAGGWSVCSGCILPVFKVIFCSLGLWGHQKWNYIPRVLFVMISITQAVYYFFEDCGCPYFDCSYYRDKAHHNKTDKFLHTGEMCSTIFSLAAYFSYSIFLVCLIASWSKGSAMIPPSKSVADVVDRKEITLLFFAFIVIVALFLSGIVLLFSVNLESNVTEDNLKTACVIATAIVLTHWASFNVCHVFAISSLSLGKYLLQHFFLCKRESLRYTIQ